MFDRLQQEQEKNLKYKKATIYIKRLEDKEGKSSITVSNFLWLNEPVTIKISKTSTNNIFKTGPSTEIWAALAVTTLVLRPSVVS